MAAKPPENPPAPGSEEGAIALTRCDELALCSDEPDRLARLYLGPGMKQAHERIARWMSDAGMTCRTDAAGNLVGRLSASGGAWESDTDAPALLLGSHVDTVPGGGRYDGVLGVVVALAAAERCRGERLPFHLDVIGFSEEEGVRYGLSYIGSSAAAGRFEPAWLDRADERGVTMHRAIAAFGLDPALVARAAYDPAKVIGYCEAHLEQGRTLERLGLSVGLVNRVAGQSRLRLSFHGRAAHAGTTPMNDRADALVAAARFITAAADHREPTGELRVTVGRIDNAPNVSNVVPERATLSLDVRHPLDAVRERTVADLVAAAERIAAGAGVRVSVDESRSQATIPMADHLGAALAAAIADAGSKVHTMASWAGHDAVVMAALCPVGMLFIRHPGGVSHHPDERADAADVGVAIDVLVRFIRRLARQVGARDSQS